MEDGSAFRAQRYEYVPSKKSSGNWGRFLIFFVAVLILGSVVFAVSKFNEAGKKEKAEKSSLPTPTEFIFPTDTPTPTPKKTEVSPTPKTTTPSPTPAKSSTDKVTGLDRSKLSIAVLNGSGVVGAASKASDALKGLGYEVVRAGNAESFTYDSTVIKVKNSKKSYVNLLKKDLGEFYTIGSASAILEESASEDAVIIVGKE